MAVEVMGKLETYGNDPEDEQLEEIDPEPSSGDEEKEAEETSVEEGGEEEGGGGDEEGGDEDEDEDDEEEEEEEEEVEAVDPAEELREKCAAGSKCAPLWTEFEKCEERVNSRTNTEETCVQELFDFLKCQDKCVSKDLFSKLK